MQDLGLQLGLEQLAGHLGVFVYVRVSTYTRGSGLEYLMDLEPGLEQLAGHLGVFVYVRMCAYTYNSYACDACSTFTY